MVNEPLLIIPKLHQLEDGKAKLIYPVGIFVNTDNMLFLKQAIQN